MAYQFQTTFWMDFTISDRFGIDAVKDTFNRSFRDWKTDHIYLTELTLVMNWKCWHNIMRLNTWNYPNYIRSIIINSVIMVWTI